jgi:hypothetical protein
MKSLNVIAMCGVVIGLTGCGGNDADSVAVPPPAAAPTVEMAAPTAAVAPAPAPAPVAPPPATGTATLPAGPAADEKVEFTTVDADGKPVPALEFMNLAIDGYERTRASMTEGETWPPITNINQLIQYRILSRLPAAPAGQQFVLNPETGKVALAPK